MKKLKYIIIGLVTVILGACSGDDSSSVDSEKPVIDTTIAGAAPASCSTIAKGEVIMFKALFTDNVALGSYSISIHHNFDQHSHDTEFDSCDLSPVQSPVNPWNATMAFTIPAGQIQHLAQQQIAIPSDIDAGDYHFTIQVTDAQGWATMRGISFKITD